MLVVVAVSFFDYGRAGIIPAFIFDNYLELFASSVTLRLYLSRIKFALIVWAVTLVIGFNIAYFLVFHVRSLLWQIGLVPAVHGAVLDLEHHPDDLVDPVPRAQRYLQPGAEGLGIVNQPL